MEAVCESLRNDIDEATNMGSTNSTIPSYMYSIVSSTSFKSYMYSVYYVFNCTDYWVTLLSDYFDGRFKTKKDLILGWTLPVT